MKIAVLGARGFIGKNLCTRLSASYDVYPVTRDVINLLNPHAVKDFLKTRSFDVILNCAATMTNDLTLNDARNNLGMFMNFYNNSKYFGKFINTGSGAEFDRTKDINLKLEEEIFNEMPTDSYGWGQNLKSRLCYDKDNFYTIRIFNCFGKGEPSTRIFPRYLNRTETIRITNDRYFDYFGIQDLCLVVQHCIEHQWSFKDVNAVYPTKYKISEVLTKFCDLNSIKKEFEIVSTSENNYTGNAEKLKFLNLNLLGLNSELINYNGN